MADYKITRERLTGFADQARRLGGVVGELSPEQIERTLAGVTPGGPLQEKTVTPDITGQEVTPDAGYYGLSKVNVLAMELPDELPKAEQATFGTVEGVTEYGFGESVITGQGVATGIKRAYGLRFTARESFMVRTLRYYGNNYHSYEITLCIWNSAGEIVRSTPLYTSAPNYPPRWYEVTLDEPLFVYAGETYTIGGYCPSGNSISLMTNYGSLTFGSKITCSGTFCTDEGAYTYPTLNNNPVYAAVNMLMEPIVVDLPDSYEIARETLDEIADEVNRIAGTTGKLSIAQILAMMKAVE